MYSTFFPSTYFCVPNGLCPAGALLDAAAKFAAVKGEGFLDISGRAVFTALPFSCFPPPIIAFGFGGACPGKAAPFCSVLCAAAFRTVEAADCTAIVLIGRVTIACMFAKGMAFCTVAAGLDKFGRRRVFDASPPTGIDETL